MEPIGLQETTQQIDWGLPEVEFMASGDICGKADNGDEAPEIDHKKTESDFLQEILAEQVELDGVEEVSQESEWYKFLEHLVPESPRDCKNPNGGEIQEEGKEEGRLPGESIDEWDMLLDRLSQMDTSVVQQILGHVESDVLQAMLQYMHLHEHRGSHREVDCQDSTALPHRAIISKNARLQLPPQMVRDKQETMNWVQNWELGKQMNSNVRLLPTQLAMFEDLHPPNKWDCWLHGNHSKQVQSPVYYIWTETGEHVHWDLPGNASQQLQSLKLKETTSQGVDSQALQGFQLQQVEQNLLFRELSQRAKQYQVPDYQELPQNMESQTQANIFDSRTMQDMADPDFSRQKSSRQMESKLSEIPSQIASALLNRAPQDMDSNVLHLLFRQIDKILLQVVPQQLPSSDSLRPQQIELHPVKHVDRHEHPKCSRPRHPVADHFGDNELNQLELLIPLRQCHNHDLESSQYEEDIQQTPPHKEFLDGCRQTRLQSLDDQQMEPSALRSQNSPRPLSDVFESSALASQYVQPRPCFMADASSIQSFKHRERDTISFVYPVLLDDLPHQERIDDCRQPQVDSNPDLPQVLMSSAVILPQFSKGMDSHYLLYNGLPQKQLQQQQQEHKRVFPEVDTELEHLIPQSIIDGSFQQVESTALHALRQRMCLTVVHHIAQEIEYNLREGIPLGMDSSLFQLFPLDFGPQEWLQPLRQETDATQSRFQYHSNEAWAVPEEDVDWDACPETSQETECSDEFRELHDDVDSMVDSITEPGEPDSPRYHMSDAIDKILYPHQHYMDADLDSLPDIILRETLSNQFEESPDNSSEHESKVAVPWCISRPPQLDEVTQYIEFKDLGDALQEPSEQMAFTHNRRSLDHIRSLNLLWNPSPMLLQSQLISVRPAGDQIGHGMDFHSEFNEVTATGSNFLEILNETEPPYLDATLNDQVTTTTHVLQEDSMISDQLQADAASEISTGQVWDLCKAERSLLEGTDSDSNSPQTSESQESETSIVSDNGAQQGEAFAQPNEAGNQLQRPELPTLQDSQIARQLTPAQQGNSVKFNPLTANARNLDKVGYTNANTVVHQRSGTSAQEEAHRKLSGKAQAHASSSEVTQQAQASSNDEEASTSAAAEINGPGIKFGYGKSRRKSPTLSQFHDPSRSVRHTIFGLLVLAGGLYLADNRDELEHQSISAAEAATELWGWLGTFLLKMAKGEIDS